MLIVTSLVVIVLNIEKERGRDRDRERIDSILVRLDFKREE